jgi:hypothetical protein
MKLSKCPYLLITKFHEDDSLVSVFRLKHEEDLWVYMGLSVMLLRLSYGCLPKDSYRMENMIPSFYCRLQQMVKVV